MGTAYSPDPAAYRVEEQQYQEQQVYQPQPQQYLEQYQEPAQQYQEQYEGELQQYQEQYPDQAQHYPQQPEAPVASRRSGSTVGFTPPPGAYPAPPGSFPGQAAGPPPTYAGDLVSAPSQHQQQHAVAAPLQQAVQPRLGLLPSLLAKVRRRLTATSNNIAERRDQAKGWLANLRDFIVSFFSGPEGQARMFSVSS